MHDDSVLDPQGTAEDGEGGDSKIRLPELHGPGDQQSTARLVGVCRDLEAARDPMQREFHQQAECGWTGTGDDRPGVGGDEGISLCIQDRLAEHVGRGGLDGLRLEGVFEALPCLLAGYGIIDDQPRDRDGEVCPLSLREWTCQDIAVDVATDDDVIVAEAGQRPATVHQHPYLRGRGIDAVDRLAAPRRPFIVGQGKIRWKLIWCCQRRAGPPRGTARQQQDEYREQAGKMAHHGRYLGMGVLERKGEGAAKKRPRSRFGHGRSPQPSRVLCYRRSVRY